MTDRLDMLLARHYHADGAASQRRPRPAPFPLANDGAMKHPMEQIKREQTESGKCRLKPEEVEAAFQDSKDPEGPVVANLLIAVKEGQLDAFRAKTAEECPKVKEAPDPCSPLGPDEITIMESAFPGPIAKAALHARYVAVMLRWHMVEQIDFDREVRPT